MKSDVIYQFHCSRKLHIGAAIWAVLVSFASNSELVMGSPPIELTLLSEETRQGELESIDGDSLTYRSETGNEVVSLRNLLQVDFLHPEEFVDDQGEPLARVRLTDGTQIRAQSVAVSGTEYTLASGQLGELKGNASDVKSVQFSPVSATNSEQWTRLVERESKNDLLIIPRGEGLDFIEGIVGGFDNEAIQFLLDGEEIAVARAKVVGVVFNRESTPKEATGKLQLMGGDQLSFSDLKIGDESFRGTLPTGAAFTGPIEQLRSIDLRLGRLVYLSEIDPRLEEYTTFFDEPQSFIKMRRDRNFNNGPIRLANRVYRRGVCLHSKTLLRYRIAEEYRRFQATMGIEDLVGRGTTTEAHVHLTIKADDRVLFEGNVKGGDPPQVLDYDVAGVRDLEILVDFGENLSIQDHLALANARLVK